MCRNFCFVLILSTVVGCGQRVEVPTACVARTLDHTGLQDELKTTSIFRLPVNWLGLYPTTLVLAETSDQQRTEQMTVFMPKDKLMMSFDVRGTFAIVPDKERTDQMFRRLPPVQQGPKTVSVTFDKAWTTYGRQIVIATSRAIVTKYDIAHIMANRAAVSEEMKIELAKKFQKTPFTVTDFGLGDVQPPDVIVTANLNAAARQEERNKAKADMMVDLTKASADLEVAKKQQMADLLDAETQAKVSAKLNEGVNKAFVYQRTLAILQEIAESDNSVYFLTREAFETPAIMMGVHQQGLNDLSTQ